MNKLSKFVTHRKYFIQLVAFYLRIVNILISNLYDTHSNNS